MKRGKKTQYKDSWLWLPERIGDAWEGIYNGFQNLENGMGIVLGNKTVPFSFALSSALKDQILKLKEGKDRIKVVFLGIADKHGKGKHPAKLFQVFLNGKVQEQKSDFPRLTGEEALAALKKEEDRRKK